MEATYATKLDVKKVLRGKKNDGIQELYFKVSQRISQDKRSKFPFE